MFNSFVNNRSIKVRFIATLLINIIRIGSAFITGLIVARVLGPKNYGNYSFLLGSFVAITSLLDLGTSTAFYTFLSQKKRSSGFYLYYFLWIAVQFLIVLLLIIAIFPDAWRNKIWLGHSKEIIILAFLASFMMNKVWKTITEAGESIRATVLVQLHNIAMVGLYLCIILVMVFLHRLTIPNLFIMNAVTYLSFSFILAKRLKNNLIATEEAKTPNVFNEFKAYCAPLIIYAIVSFAYSFADIWLLQNFGGAVQQAFYSVGFRFSVICLIATTSMLKIFWKEIAEANESGNKERLHYLYTTISRGLCFVGATGACFLIPFSRQILFFLLGPKYERGWLCLSIMFLYPIHQALGQINGSYFYATARTKLYSKIGIIMMLASIVVAYFVVASRSATIPGLGLGSVGLALKMVILQMISVNVLTYFICKLSGWKIDFLYQFIIIGLLLIVSFAIKGFLSWLFHILSVSFHPLLWMVFSAPIYILAVGLIVYLFPNLSGLKRKQVTNFTHSLYRFLKTR